MTAKLEKSLAGIPRFVGRRPALVSAVAVALVMVVSMVVFGPRHIISDDRGMNNILQGVVTEGTPFGVFMNILLSWPLYWLYQATPELNLNWLTCCEYLLYYFAFVFVCYVLLTPVDKPLSLFPAGLFCFAIVPLFSLEITFTLAAATAAAGGALLLFHQLRRHKPWYTLVPPMLLCALAFMMRHNAALMALIFIGVSMVCVLLKRENLRSLRTFVGTYGKFFVALAALLLCVYSLRWGGKAIERAHPTEMPQYNDPRALFIDYPKETYGDIVEELYAIGVSENTYALILDWTSADPEFFWTDIWVKLKALQPGFSLYFGVSRLSTAYLSSLLSLPLFPMGMALAVAGMWLAVQRRAGWGTVLAPVLLLGALYGMLLFLCARGRLTSAVINSCLFAMVCALLYCLPAPREEGRDLKGFLTTLLSFAILCVPSVLHLGNLYFLPAVEGLPRAVIREVIAREDDIFLNHSDLNFWQGYGVFERSEPQPNLVSLGGWGTTHPATLKQYEALGITSPMRELDKDNMYILADSEDYVRRLVLYFEEHTDKNATFEVAGEIRRQKIYKVTAAG